MGRHSRGAGEAPAPLPDPPARHPYAARSVEDTGTWDRSTYRVVDVGLPEGTPGSARSALRSVPELGAGPSRFGAGESATRLDPEAPRYGATRADLATPPSVRRDPPAPRPDPTPRFAGTTEPRFNPDPRFGTESGFGAEPRFDPEPRLDPEPRYDPGPRLDPEPRFDSERFGAEPRFDPGPRLDP